MKLPIQMEYICDGVNNSWIPRREDMVDSFSTFLHFISGKVLFAYKIVKLFLIL